MKNCLLILFLLFSISGIAQLLPDSLINRDSLLLRNDSLSSPLPVKDTISRDSLVKENLRKQEFSTFLKKLDTSIYSNNTFYRFNHPIKLVSTERRWNGKEGFFYSIIALLLFFAFSKNAFSRYLDDLFRTFFRTTLKQRQTRDQLMNAPLPSLFFNILYILSAALFITLLFQHFGLGNEHSFILLFSYSIGGLLAVYAIKFITLKLCGWVLGISEATNTYIFIVFTTNKVIGIVLLPFIVGMAFMEQQVYDIVFTLSLCLLGVLFVYRFYLSYISVQKQASINFFHFLLYLAAFEIAPLLLINKLLLVFFS